MKHIAYIGIGSNLGNKLDQCNRAVNEILKVDNNRLLASSSFFKTRPIGYTSQDWFINGVIKIETELNPFDLLQTLKSIEFRMGREETFRWGPRIIDLDILFYDEIEINTPELQIPHPQIPHRQFVLIPLSEIDKDLVHPTFKKTIKDLLEELKEDQGVEKI